MSKEGHRTERIQYIWSYTHNIDIQMKQKELSKTLLMISNCKKTFGLLVYINKFQGFKD